jgi:hypothetical protein
VKRNVQGLASVSAQDDSLPDGVYLVEIQAVRHQWERVRPFYSVRFSVVASKAWAGGLIIGRIWCTPKALWKLSWFLRDFGYDADLIDRDEIDDKRLVGLRGVLKVSHTTLNGRRFTNLDAFAPAETWDEMPAVRPAPAKPRRRKAAS